MDKVQTIAEGIKLFAACIGALMTIIGAVAALSKKFRAKVKALILKDSSSDELMQKIDLLGEQISEINGTISVMKQDIIKLGDQLDKNDESTVLTLKYQILGICNRARDYNVITSADKEVLCSLYDKYVNEWHLNHYIKTEADWVINNLKVVNSYHEEEVK